MSGAESAPASSFNFYVVRRGDVPPGRTFHPTSAYADICWLAAIGPTTLMLYRVLVAVAMCDSGWVPIQRDDLLATLGMRGEAASLDTAFDRLVAHDLVIRPSFDLIVRPVMPPVNDLVVARHLPSTAQDFHRASTTQDGPY